MSVVSKDGETHALGTGHGTNGRKDKLCSMSDEEQLLKLGILYTF